MRWRRPRITVRRLLVLVATVAVALAVVREFDEGLPPRFVIRDIPRRIERLRPGMRREQVYEALGLGRSWVRGGLGPIGEIRCWGNDYARGETYRPFGRSAAEIYLSFRSEANPPALNNQDYPLLTSASFRPGGRTIAKMPHHPRVAP
jgi:hypothetical protein